MVIAWYRDDDETGDQQEPHMPETPTFLDAKDFEKLGISYLQILSDDYDNCEQLNKLKKDINCSYEDEITVAPGQTDKYDEWVKAFWKEHMHPDEEIRLATDGCGYFEVRDLDDKWIRIEMTKGDLIILPAGVYHRFALDKKNYFKVRRYFTGVTERTAFDRPADTHKARKAYLNKYGKS